MPSKTLAFYEGVWYPFLVSSVLSVCFFSMWTGAPIIAFHFCGESSLLSRHRSCLLSLLLTHPSFLALVSIYEHSTSHHHFVLFMSSIPLESTAYQSDIHRTVQSWWVTSWPVLTSNLTSNWLLQRMETFLPGRQVWQLLKRELKAKRDLRVHWRMYVALNACFTLFH